MFIKQSLLICLITFGYTYSSQNLALDHVVAILKKKTYGTISSDSDNSVEIYAYNNEGKQIYYSNIPKPFTKNMLPQATLQPLLERLGFHENRSKYFFQIIYDLNRSSADIAFSNLPPEN